VDWSEEGSEELWRSRTDRRRQRNLSSPRSKRPRPLGRDSMNENLYIVHIIQWTGFDGINLRITSNVHGGDYPS